MRLIRHPTGWLAGLVLLVASAAVHADSPALPLRLIPEQADLLVQVDHPRKLVETLTRLELVKQFQALDPVRDLYDSTNYRRFLQLVGHVEKELGLPWPELLDRLAGGGMAFASKIGPQPAPVVLVVQGKDEQLLRKFMKFGQGLIEQELARQEVKAQPEKYSYRNLEGFHVGDKFYAVAAGSALVVSNNTDAMHKSLDLHFDKGKKSLAQVAGVAEARKLLPAEPLASLWFNLDVAHNAPQAKDLFTMPRNDAILTVLFGGYLDIVGRAPFVCAGLHQEKDGLLATIRMPRGREGMAPGLTVHIPPAEQPDGRPLLEPKGVLFSSRFYLDFSKFWEERTKLFNQMQVKAFEDGDKNSARFLTGKRISQVFGMVGASHRFVATYQAQRSYKIEPGQVVPAFALVTSLRQPEEFEKTVGTALRGAALLGGLQVGLKGVEEKQGDVTIVGYRFPEDGKLAADTGNIRFNFSPCFARVGDQFIFCSTLELCHELVDILQEEAKNPAKRRSAGAYSQIYSSGAAEYLKSVQDQLLTQTILDRAVPPDEAKEQVKAFIDLVRRLGNLQVTLQYRANDFRYEFKLKSGK